MQQIRDLLFQVTVVDFLRPEQKILFQEGKMKRMKGVGLCLDHGVFQELDKLFIVVNEEQKELFGITQITFIVCAGLGAQIQQQLSRLIR